MDDTENLLKAAQAFTDLWDLRDFEGTPAHPRLKALLEAIAAIEVNR